MDSSMNNIAENGEAMTRTPAQVAYEVEYEAKTTSGRSSEAFVRGEPALNSRQAPRVIHHQIDHQSQMTPVTQLEEQAATAKSKTKRKFSATSTHVSETSDQVAKKRRKQSTPASRGQLRSGINTLPSGSASFAPSIMSTHAPPALLLFHGNRYQDQYGRNHEPPADGIGDMFGDLLYIPYIPDDGVEDLSGDAQMVREWNRQYGPDSA